MEKYMEQKVKDKAIRLIENAAISLIKNAESIVGDYEYRSDIPLEIKVIINPNLNIANLEFKTEFFTERIIGKDGL